MDAVFLWDVLLLSALFNIAADLLGRMWTKDGKTRLLAVAAVAYAVDQTFFSLSLTAGLLAKNIFIVFLLAAIIDVLVGVFHFKERLSRTNLVGLLLGLVALLLLNL